MPCHNMFIAVQTSTFFQTRCLSCDFPAIVELTHDEMERRRSQAHPDITTNCPACGQWYREDALLGPGLADPRAALALTTGVLQDRLCVHLCARQCGVRYSRASTTQFVALPSPQLYGFAIANP